MDTLGLILFFALLALIPTELVLSAWSKKAAEKRKPPAWPGIFLYGSLWLLAFLPGALDGNAVSLITATALGAFAPHPNPKAANAMRQVLAIIPVITALILHFTRRLHG